jgi:hypothetical protein
MSKEAPTDELVELPTDARTTSPQFQTYLISLQGNLDDKNKPFVLNKLLAYKGFQSSGQWNSLYPEDGCGSEYCATVSTFWWKPKHGKKA